MEVFAVVAPGLESVAAAELGELGFVPRALESGGVTFEANLAGLWRANLYSRVVSRFLVRMGTWMARDLDALERGAREVRWSPWIRPRALVRLSVRCRKSAVRHSGAVADRIFGVLAEQLGVQPAVGTAQEQAPTGDPEAWPQRVHVRLFRDRCTVSVDSSGPLLHRRGYRIATGAAPLRETLAAGVLKLCGWSADAPLVVPFCGAGTFAIEAACIATGRVPGALRRFALEAWPCIRQGAVTRPAVPAPEPLPIPVQASDASPSAVDLARDNAARAGVADAIAWRVARVEDVVPPAGVGGAGWVVCNPPYGTRLAPGVATETYRALGQVLRRRFVGWHAVVLVRRSAHARALRLDLQPRAVLPHGGLHVTVLAGRVY